MSKLYDIHGVPIKVGDTVAHTSGARYVGLTVGVVTRVTAKRFSLGKRSNLSPDCALVIQGKLGVCLGWKNRKRLDNPCEHCDASDMTTVLDDGILIALGCESCGAMFDL